jgi:hypothetical protein
MQMDLDETIHMQLEGAMVELLLYQNYLVQEGKKTIMYVELNKALNSTLDAYCYYSGKNSPKHWKGGGLNATL